MIYNIPNLPLKALKTLYYQVDISPILFSLLNWSYESKMYGKDILKMSTEESKAFISIYQKVGLMKQNRYLAILIPKKMTQVYRWDTQKTPHGCRSQPKINQRNNQLLPIGLPVI